MNCMYCGNEFADDVKFCPYCGREPVTLRFCPKCGADLPAGSQFCSRCGNDTAGFISPAPVKAKKRMPVSTLVTGLVSIVVILALVAYILFGNSLGTKQVMVSEKSFATPEAVIGHFVKSVAANDFNAASEAFAINDYADKFDFSGFVDHIKVLIPPTMMAPSEYKMYAEINRIRALADLANATKMFAYSFLVTEDLRGNIEMDEKKRANFEKAVDPSSLKGLKLLNTDLAKPELQRSAANMKNFQKQAGFYGGDEIAEYVALYELNGVYYWGGFGLIRYGDSWKIMRLNSILANQSAMGTVKKTTQEAYQSLLE